MSRRIIIDTEDLKTLLDLTKQYEVVKVYDGDTNTDGEGVWHCDVYFADTMEEIIADAPNEVFSFNELKGE